MRYWLMHILRETIDNKRNIWTSETKVLKAANGRTVIVSTCDDDIGVATGLTSAILVLWRRSVMYHVLFLCEV